MEVLIDLRDSNTGIAGSFDKDRRLNSSVGEVNFLIDIIEVSGLYIEIKEKRIILIWIMRLKSRLW